MSAGEQLTTKPVLLAATEQDEVFVTVTEAEADLVGSSTEVALTTPVPAAVAVHVTPFGEPVTLAVNCWVVPTNNIAFAGLNVTEMPPGEGEPATVTVADADFVLSSTEVAVTVPVPGVTAVNIP